MEPHTMHHGTCARRVCALLALLLVLAGCVSPRREEPPPKAEDLEQILVAVPDPEMQERWREAHANGRLPPLESLPDPGPPVDHRERARVSETPSGPREPVALPPDAPAGVRVFAPDGLPRYEGPFLVSEIDPRSKLAGTLAGHEQPLVIHFRLPRAARLDDSLRGAQTHLRLREEVEDHSVRKLVHLRNTNRAVVLLYISDGGRKPYEGSFEEPSLAVRQVEPTGAEAESREPVAPIVEVSYAGQTLQLKPATPVSGRDAEGEVVFFLITSYRCPPAQRLRAEGDLYHVTLLAYRPAR